MVTVRQPWRRLYEVSGWYGRCGGLGVGDQWVMLSVEGRGLVLGVLYMAIGACERASGGGGATSAEVGLGWWDR